MEKLKEEYHKRDVITPDVSYSDWTFMNECPALWQLVNSDQNKIIIIIFLQNTVSTNKPLKFVLPDITRMLQTPLYPDDCPPELSTAEY